MSWNSASQTIMRVARAQYCRFTFYSPCVRARHQFLQCPFTGYNFSPSPPYGPGYYLRHAWHTARSPFVFTSILIPEICLPFYGREQPYGFFVMRGKRHARTLARFISTIGMSCSNSAHHTTQSLAHKVIYFMLARVGIPYLNSLIYMFTSRLIGYDSYIYSATMVKSFIMPAYFRC